MKKVISLSIFLCVVGMFCNTVFAFTYESIDPKELLGEPTKDTPSSWAVDYVKNAIDLGFVPETLQKGYSQQITRAEFCALAVKFYEKVNNAEIVERKTFNDTKDINVEKMAGLNVVSGVGNNNFDPQSLLTREQAAIILSNLMTALGKPLDEVPPTFSDNNLISSWARDCVGRVQAAKIMNGTGNNNFSPKGNYTREQSITTIINIFNLQ